MKILEPGIPLSHAKRGRASCKGDRPRLGKSATISLRKLWSNLHCAARADSGAWSGEPSGMQTAGSARDRLFRLRCFESI